ncbi:MAG: hypothetical protein HKN16_02020 [Saprospiraceae bacterium]|nr:hypothetical protein [Saprospiraceae bacterium]
MAKGLHMMELAHIIPISTEFIVFRAISAPLEDFFEVSLEWIANSLEERV